MWYLLIINMWYLKCNKGSNINFNSGILFKNDELGMHKWIANEIISLTKVLECLLPIA